VEETEPEPAEAGTTVVNVSLDPDLVDRAALRLGGARTNRAILGRAVQAWLPVVVAGLGNLGFGGRPIGRRRPRRLDKATWSALHRAAEQTGLAAPELLRACLELAVRAEPSQPPSGGKG
jgi:hypothetical protein